MGCRFWERNFMGTGLECYICQHKYLTVNRRLTFQQYWSPCMLVQQQVRYSFSDGREFSLDTFHHMCGSCRKNIKSKSMCTTKGRCQRILMTNMDRRQYEQWESAFVKMFICKSMKLQTAIGLSSVFVIHFSFFMIVHRSKSILRTIVLTKTISNDLRRYVI